MVPPGHIVLEILWHKNTVFGLDVKESSTISFSYLLHRVKEKEMVKDELSERQHNNSLIFNAGFPEETSILLPLHERNYWGEVVFVILKPLSRRLIFLSYLFFHMVFHESRFPKLLSSSS